MPAAALICNPLLWVGATHALHLTQPSAIDLNGDYIDARAVALKGERPKNLIHIFLESTESTFLNKVHFGDVSQPIERLLDGAWQATNVDQVELTNWTLAGHVAATCGVPLLPLGVIRRNSFGLVDEILPEATCLGDILARRGYSNVFLKGASLDFAGTRGFAKSHGYQRLLGLDELSAKFPGRVNGWGLHDEDLFSVAYDEIAKLDSARAPFSIMLTTIGGHAPHGFVSPICLNEPFVNRQPNETLKAVACTNLLTERFVARLKANGLMENAVVVIQSDHLAMRNDVYDTLEELPRRNLFLVLGAGRHGVETKPASTVDIFPTILVDLGFDLPEGRMGLGRALQTGAHTLVERFGVSSFNHAIIAEQHLRDRLWGLKSAPGT